MANGQQVVVHQNEESPWDGSRFSREKRTGVAMGLDLAQVIFLGVGIGIAVLLIIIGGFPLGFILGLLTAALFAGVGIPRFHGTSLLEWMWRFLTYRLRRRAGQLKFVQPMNDGIEIDIPSGVMAEDLAPALVEDEAEAEVRRNKKGKIKPGRGERFRLPGEFNEMRVYRLPGGAGLVYDPRRKEAMITAQLETSKAFDLESWEDKEDRTFAFSKAITSVAGIAGLVRMQFSDQTTIISGAKVQRFYDQKRKDAPKIEDPETGELIALSGENIDPFLHQSFQDLMAEAQGMTVHDLWLTVVLSKDQLNHKIKSFGGGLEAFMEVAMGVMDNIETFLPEAGAYVTSWHTPRTLAGLARAAFDPKSTMAVSEREGDRAGAAPSSAGPLGMETKVDRVVSEGALHRTYLISEWPQAQARLGFLDRMVFAGDFRHTVTVYMKPRGIRDALKTTQRRKADWKTTDRIRRRLDRQESMEHDREMDDIESEEAELMEGNAAVRIAGLITVSAESERELEASCGELIGRAAQANCELRPLYMQQDAAFVGGALPFARVVM